MVKCGALKKDFEQIFGDYKGNDYFCSRKSPKDPMNGISIERLSQTGECCKDGESSILEGASAVAQGVLEEIEALAGTTACKSVQLVRNNSRFLSFATEKEHCYMKQNSTDILRKRAELGLQQITQGRCYTTQDVISVCR